MSCDLILAVPAKDLVCYSSIINVVFPICLPQSTITFFKQALHPYVKACTF
ncbi:MAG: hypothetical protein ABFC34_06170 [Methanobacterium sp.]